MVDSNMNVLAVLRKQLDAAGNDLSCEIIEAMAEKLMSFEADVIDGDDAEQEVTTQHLAG